VRYAAELAPSLDKREADVTVVFADITGYTRLSAQLELDQVNQLGSATSVPSWTRS
jgi:class 3 adenylate cyclase